jgi:hypothetical protein
MAERTIDADADKATDQEQRAAQQRRRPLPPNATIADLRAALSLDQEEGETGPNATTEPESPAEHYFLAFRGLRALGRRAIWRAVVQHVASRYDFSDSDAKFTRSQVQAMALEAMRLAESDCLEFNPNYAATIVRISRPQDPYIVLEDSARIP